MTAADAILEIMRRLVVPGNRRQVEMRTVEHLLDETGLTIDAIATRANLDVERVRAIADGRWTPSPAERERIAAALGVGVDEISWGHTMNPRNVRYRRFGLTEEF